jgi:hypothetical protein
VNKADNGPAETGVVHREPLARGSWFVGAISVFLGLWSIMLTYLGVMLLPAAAVAFLVYLVNDHVVLRLIVAVVGGLIVFPLFVWVVFLFVIPAYLDVVRIGGLFGQRWSRLTPEIVLSLIADRRKLLWQDLARVRRYFHA